MLKQLLIGGALGVAMLIGAWCSAAAPQQDVPPAATPLFDGVSLDGWKGIGAIDPRDLAALSDDERARHFDEWTAEARNHWRAHDAQLICDGDGPFLATARGYDDFELQLQYKITPGADTGVYLRGTPQVQIWDHTDTSKFAAGADKGSGGLWNNTEGEPSRFPLVCADKPVGEWNKLRVMMVGAYVTVWLNDQLVVDHAIMENAYDAKAQHRRPIVAAGPIILQTHGGETRWRNISIREIAPAEANELLRRGGPNATRAAEGFTSIFNGRDFTGWRGDTDKNAVEDGAILSRDGTIYTDEEYDDFVVRFEFQLPERGNNGLAIRYPGQGDPAYAGMCEIQVLDTPRWADEIKPQQAHGSAYGMVAAEQGYLRDVGQWNYQEVTVRGSTIRVELNGTPILDCDLSQVKEPMVALQKFAGRARTTGHFGFAGHGDAVKFRNIQMKRLP